MVFSSHLFVYYFLPATLLVYYALPRAGRHLWLALASYFFYGWANPAFMALMFVSTAIDYVCGQRIEALPAERVRPRRAWLIVSIVANLALLGFFKYFNFALDSYNALLAAVGLGHLQPDLVLRVALPLGISFYTFQSMSYSLDIYRGRARPLESVVDFALYVSLFPQLVAGPIIRFSELADQLKERTHTFEKFSRGVAFFGLGMAKKILLANPCGFAARFNYLGLRYNTPLYGWVEEQFGLSRAEFVILYSLGLVDGVTASEIAASTAFPKNTLSRAVSRLVKLGLIQRSEGQADRRQQNLMLTFAGHAILDEAMPRFVALEEEMLAPLSLVERETLSALMAKVVLAMFDSSAPAATVPERWPTATQTLKE